MQAKQLLIIGSSATVAEQPPVDAVMAMWPADERPGVTFADLCETREGANLPADIGVAWVVIDTPDDHLYELIARLQDRRVPVLLSRTDERRAIGTICQSGVVAAPIETPPVALCGMLRALWCQVELLAEMSSEMRVLSAHRGGLCEQIDKMDEELRMAAQLQREFLPGKVSELHGVHTNVLYRPAGYVSGDIYDICRLDEDHMGFFVADAVGHGVPAALLTVSIKRSLCTKQIDPALPDGYRLVPPAEALAMLNSELIAMQAGRIRTATAVYAVLNCRTRRLDIARAGHPYPLLLKPDGATVTLEPDGAMLGVFPEETFQEQQVTLEPADRLLLYSDGFEVAFRSKPARGGTVASHEYTNAFEQLRHGSSDEAISWLERQLDRQMGSLNQLDDLTAVLIGVGTGGENCPEQAASAGADTVNVHRAAHRG